MEHEAKRTSTFSLIMFNLVLLLGIGAIVVVAASISKMSEEKRQKAVAEKSEHGSHRDVHRERGEVEEALTRRSAISRIDWAKARVDLLNLRSTVGNYLQMYRIDHGQFPDTLEPLRNYGLHDANLKDTQGLDVHYEKLPNGAARIYMYGPDGVGNTDDDIEIVIH